MGLCNLDSRTAPVKPEFKVPLRSHILGGPTINKLIALGGQVPLHFSVPLSPLARWQHNVCVHFLSSSRFINSLRKSLQLQLPLYCCTVSAAPIPSLQCGQGTKSHNLPAQRLVQWPGLESVFLVIGVRNMLSNQCSEILTCVQLFSSGATVACVENNKLRGILQS